MDYTEKVYEYLRNPKNMGRIEDADGVGTVGNPVCVLPGSVIHIKEGISQIEKLEVGMDVLNHLGFYSRINHIYKRPYKGAILTFKNKLGKISLTPDHLLLGIKIPEKNKFKRTQNKKQLPFLWQHASEFKKSDIILYPIFKQKTTQRFVDVDIRKKKYDFISRELPDKILLDENFLKLAGYYLAEGCARDKSCRTYIIFTFHIKEEKFVQEVQEIIEQIFGIGSKIKRIPARKTVSLFVYNSLLARYFKNLFGGSAIEKKIPEIIMNLPPQYQQSLLIGLFRGDGYCNLKRNGPRFGYATISPVLVNQIKILLLRQHISSSIYKEPSKVIDGVRHRESYRIHIGQRDSVKKMCEIMQIAYTPTSYSSVDDWFDGNYMFTPITEIEEFSYNGYVYNLEVEEAHSFVSEGFSLHNCGDVMKIYIKVKDNIIEDIKFETFGCGAAIATSSVVTELAKGKTLEEAEKISNKEVVDFLGGLPPIKMHCSLLAEDGLKAAIADYRRRKDAGGKREGSEDSGG